MDDRSDILDGLIDCIEHNKGIFPRKLVLIFHHYDGRRWETIRTAIGQDEGCDPDHNYFDKVCQVFFASSLSATITDDNVLVTDVNSPVFYVAPNYSRLFAHIFQASAPQQHELQPRLWKQQQQQFVLGACHRGLFDNLRGHLVDKGIIPDELADIFSTPVKLVNEIWANISLSGMVVPSLVGLKRYPQITYLEFLNMLTSHLYKLRVKAEVNIYDDTDIRDICTIVVNNIEYMRMALQHLETLKAAAHSQSEQGQDIDDRLVVSSPQLRQPRQPQQEQLQQLPQLLKQETEQEFVSPLLDQQEVLSLIPLESEQKFVLPMLDQLDELPLSRPQVQQEPQPLSVQQQEPLTSQLELQQDVEVPLLVWQQQQMRLNIQDEEEEPLLLREEQRKRDGMPLGIKIGIAIAIGLLSIAVVAAMFSIVGISAALGLGALTLVVVTAIAVTAGVFTGNLSCSDSVCCNRRLLAPRCLPIPLRPLSPSPERHLDTEVQTTLGSLETQATSDLQVTPGIL